MGYFSEVIQIRLCLDFSPQQQSEFISLFTESDKEDCVLCFQRW